MKNSPLNELTAQDIARKQKKLDRINTRIKRKDDKFKAKVASGKKGTDMDITRHERSLSGLKERKHKTEYQIETGKRGRPTSLRNEEWLAGTSRKSSSPVNRLDKGKELISSAEGAASGAYRKSALNMLGISHKSSPLNDMTQQESELTEEQKKIVASYRNEFFQDSEIDLREQLMTDKEILTIDSLKQNMPKDRAGIRENIKMQHEIMKPLWNLKNK